MGVWLLALAAAYIIAALVLHRRPRRNQVVLFSLGLAIAIGVLSGPVERLALQRLFTAYIFQQVMLVMAAAPLLLLGTPDWMLRPLFANRLIKPIWVQLTRPVVAILIFSVFFATIHYPALCNQVCHAQPLYHAIRWTLLLAGVLLWWPLLSPLPEFPRLSYPLQILYLVALMVPMVAISAPITFARSVLYAFYQEAPHPWGLSPIHDQTLGGLLMWVGQGLFVLAIVTAIFFRWASQGEDYEPENGRSAHPGAATHPETI